MKKFLRIVLTVSLLIGLFFGGKSVYEKLMSKHEYDEAKRLSSIPIATVTSTYVDFVTSAPTLTPAVKATAYPMAETMKKADATPGTEPATSPVLGSATSEIDKTTVEFTSEPATVAEPKAKPTEEPTAAFALESETFEFVETTVKLTTEPTATPEHIVKFTAEPSASPFSELSINESAEGDTEITVVPVEVPELAVNPTVEPVVAVVSEKLNSENVEANVEIAVEPAATLEPTVKSTEESLTTAASESVILEAVEVDAGFVAESVVMSTTEPTPDLNIFEPKATLTATPAPTLAKENLSHSDPFVMELLQTNLDALRDVNPDVMGWITIPDTNISYPIVQGEDNDFYLNHTWKKQANDGGAVFMESENDPDMRDFNTIIYGHNMNDNSMFSDLVKFANSNFMVKHPSVYIVTDNGVYRYDFFSTYKASVKSIAYGMKIQTTKKRNELIQFSLNYGVVKSGIVPNVDDHLLTLSTCSGFGHTARWVVVGVLNKDGSCLLNELK